MSRDFPKSIAVTALLVGMVSLMFELVQVRLLSFFIGKSMDVLAIPIALLGLAMGSMFRQYVFKGDPEALVRRLSVAVLPSVGLSLIVFFGVANTFFNEVNITLATPTTEALKVVVYGAVFLPPYAVFGALLATLFTQWSERIGTLYFFDLLGAAVGCAMAPLFLTWFGLPLSLAALLIGATLIALIQATSTRSRVITMAVASGFLASVASGYGFSESVDPTTLARVFRDLRRDGATEVEVRWNAIARTSLLTRKGSPNKRHVIVQDNGLSNVQVTSFKTPYREDAATAIGQRSLPYRLGMEPEKILVTFAGIGRDMIMFDELSRGKADITGIELNPTVVEWQNHPALTVHRLPEFFGKPNIHLLAREGRDFLNTDTQSYDLIFVANNGAVHTGRTGHSRKFLDTEEAMRAYLARLEPGGMLMFMNQPVSEKLRSFRAIWESEGRTDFSDCVYIYGNGSPTLDTMLIKPEGFSLEDRQTILGSVREWRLKRILAPSSVGIERAKTILTAPLDTLQATTDDQPFTHTVEWWNFRGLPDPERAHDAPYVSGWAKMFTLILFSGVAGSVAVIATLLGSTEQRVPSRWTVYLLLSGIAYMCVQIPLIAKTELLVGNPLYAVSINLAMFLIFNAFGSMLHDAAPSTSPFLRALGVFAGAVWAMVSIHLFLEPMLSSLLPLKAVLVAVFVGPVAFAMGMFYPWCVGELVRNHKAEAVPMTYGLTTLASVVGSAFAMTAVINLGFSTVIGVGVVLYGLSAVVGGRYTITE